MQPNMSDDPKQTLHCLLESMPAADRSTRAFMAQAEGFSVNFVKLGEGRVRQREFGRR